MHKFISLQVPTRGHGAEYVKFTEFLAALFNDVQDWENGATAIVKDIVNIVMKWAVFNKHVSGW